MGARGLILLPPPINAVEQTDQGEASRVLEEDEVDRLRYSGHMDISKMLAELHSERKQLDEAIVTLERLALGRGKRRGRPPAWMKDATKGGSKRRGRPPGTNNKPKEDPSA
jgi:hypothetical protein